MKTRIFYAFLISIVLYTGYVSVFGNMAVHVISNTNQDKKVVILANGESLFKGLVKKETGDIFQDITAIGGTFFPRLFEIEVEGENCEIKTHTVFVFLPRTVVVLIQDNCEVEFQNHFGSVAYF